MQPEELPAALPAEPTPDTRLTDALMALATAHSGVQEVLHSSLVSPQTKAERAAVDQLGQVRRQLWAAIKELGEGHPLYGNATGGET